MVSSDQKCEGMSVDNPDGNSKRIQVGTYDGTPLGLIEKQCLVFMINTNW